MAVDYIDKGNDDGTVFGQTAAMKIGFYGLTTPIVKQTLTKVVVSASTLGTAIRGLMEINAALAALGIITTI
jgi:hypothetical protein